MSARTVAQPGDGFMLLLPDDDERVALRARQAALRARFGGQPHEPVHLTCQRFTLADERVLESLIGQLRSSLIGASPFPIVATGLISYHAPFWATRLLRWLIEPTDALLGVRATIDAALEERGIAPHYAWVQYHVTALEGVEAREPGAHEAEGMPHHLFVARRVVVSRPQGGREFDLLDDFRLAD